MAAAPVAELWTVVIIGEDSNLTSTYKLSSDTSLHEVKQLWSDDVPVFDDNWRFSSADEETVYEDHMTLEMVGVSVPKTKIVTLRIQLSDQPTPLPIIEISIFLQGQLRRRFVAQTDRLDRILPRVSGSKTVYEHNGRIILPNQTVAEAGLQDKAVIYPSTSRVRVSVSFTRGVMKTFILLPDALVCHLMDQVSRHVYGEFSLKCGGRTLHRQESVRDLTLPVEVSTVQFSVNMDGRQIEWKAGSGEIKFRDFVFQLSIAGNLERSSLERMNFHCVGCERRVRQSDEEFQLLETACCRVRSLHLEARLPVVNRGVNPASEVGRQMARRRKKTTVRRRHNALQKIHLKPQSADIRDAAMAIKVQRLKLLVVYGRNDFTPDVSHCGFESQGNSPFDHIKCHVDLRVTGDGWIPFSDLRAALEPFFKGGTFIGSITQWRGIVGTRKVARVTSCSDDEYRGLEYCDCKGVESLGTDVVDPNNCVIKCQGKILATGERRTVLWVHK